MDKEKDNINLLQVFIAKEEVRSKIPIKGALQAMMDYMEYIIRTEFDKNSRTTYKFKKRKAQLSQNFINGISALSRQQKVKYYSEAVHFIVDFSEGIEDPPEIGKEMMTVEAYTRSINLKIWKKKKIRIDRAKHILYAQKSDKIKHYNLGDYLLRESKNKDYHSFVLEATNNTPHESMRTVHIGFQDPNKYIQWFKFIKQSVDYKRWEYISKFMGKDNETASRYSAKSYTPQLKPAYKLGTPELQKHKVESYNQNKIPKAGLSDSSDDQHPVMKSQPPSFGKYQSDQQVHTQQPRQQHPMRAHVQNSPLKQTIPKFYDVSRDNSHNGAMRSTHTIVDSLMQSDNDEEIEVIEAKDKVFVVDKKHLDLFHKILPDYQLEDLESETNFQSIISQKNFKVIQNQENKKRIKVFMNFEGNYPKEAIFATIANTSYMLKYNDAIEELTIKTMISSENSAILYQKNKAYNKLYRPRDFVYIRHVFSNAGDLYIVDKSLENSSCPPFITIVRGELCIFWGILRRNNKTSLIIDIDQTNQGYLNDMQELNLTMKFVQSLRLMESRLKNDIDSLLKFKVFDLSWDITKNEVNVLNNQVRKKRKTERIQIRKLEKKQQQLKIKQEKIADKVIQFQEPQQQKTKADFYKKEPIVQKPKTHDTIPINKNLEQTIKQNEQSIMLTRKDMQKVGEIDLKQLQQKEQQKAVLSIVRKFDNQGYVIISKDFIKTKYKVTPVPNCPIDLQEQIQGHPIWKGEWRHDEKDGGIIFINQKKIQEQKGVLKFILTKIGKNILSGKSVLSISLPVDIFSSESNLERLVYSMTYAPIFLERCVKKGAIQKLKMAIAFGISNSPLYLNMQKPFNPILGETFSCWINGCPAYAQQISHHPPIASLYMVGRGYRISVQLESKVELSMNSGTGINDGIYRIRYDDGTEVCFMTPGGQIAGLTYGDRKFNMVGKSYYWIQKENLVLQIVFNPTKKGFFSMGKQQQPSDYLEGTVYQVKPDFLDKFISKKKIPVDKEIVREHGKVTGIWNKYIDFDGQRILDLSRDYPVKLQYQANPLPSDANWRQDIAYRRILQVSRAQTEKERLEILQRQDRKLRQHKGKHK